MKNIEFYADSIENNTYLKFKMQGIMENSRIILNYTKILLIIIHILGHKLKEPWKIPEKNGINCNFIGYETYLRL